MTDDSPIKGKISRRAFLTSAAATAASTSVSGNPLTKVLLSQLAAAPEPSIAATTTAELPGFTTINQSLEGVLASKADYIKAGGELPLAMLDEKVDTAVSVLRRAYDFITKTDDSNLARLEAEYGVLKTKYIADLYGEAAPARETLAKTFRIADGHFADDAAAKGFSREHMSDINWLKDALEPEKSDYEYGNVYESLRRGEIDFSTFARTVVRVKSYRINLLKKNWELMNRPDFNALDARFTQEVEGRLTYLLGAEVKQPTDENEVKEQKNSAKRASSKTGDPWVSYIHDARGHDPCASEPVPAQEWKGERY